MKLWHNPKELLEHVVMYFRSRRIADIDAAVKMVLNKSNSASLFGRKSAWGYVANPYNCHFHSPYYYHEHHLHCDLFSALVC